MYRKNFVIYLIVIVITLFVMYLITGPGLEAGWGKHSIVHPCDEAGNLIQVEPGMTEIYGQIVSISAQAVYLDTGNHSQWFQFAKHIQIQCNGLPAVWMALKPIAHRAYFEAKVFLNQHGEVVFLSGFYYGEVCVLQNWRYIQNFLELRLYFPESGDSCWKVVKNGAILPQGDWLEEETEIYILYNQDDKIRAVFLPDR